MDDERNITYCQTKQLAALQLTGKEAADFLQGQLTVNTKNLAIGRWRRAAYCSRQGRVLACGIICHSPINDTEDCFLFIIGVDIATTLEKQLRRFVLRAKVSITVLPTPILARQCTPTLSLIGNTGDATWTDGILALHDQSEPYLYCCLDSTRDDSWLMTVSNGHYCANDNIWKQANIRQAIPWITEKTQDRFIPQFINLDVLGGIDFDKGCYVGQEVIARLHYLGRVKSRCLIVTGHGNAPGAATPIKNRDGNLAGEIVNSATTDEGYIALAVIKLSEAEKVLLIDEQAVQQQPLPYTLPTKND